ncbi:MAG: DUF389 domain-containing protein [Acidimicrobiia bacterium]
MAAFHGIGLRDGDVLTDIDHDPPPPADAAAEIDLSDPEFQDYEGDLAIETDGLDFSSLWSQSSLRGLGAIVIAVVLIKAPTHSPRLFAVVIAIMLVAWSLGGVVELFRGERRDLTTVGKVLFLAAVGITIVVWPRLTIEDMGRLLGIGLGVAGLISLYIAYRRRRETAMTEKTIGALLYVAVGAALLISPATMLHMVILAFAIYWFIAGVIAVVTNMRSEGAPTAIGPSETWQRFLEWVQTRPNTADDRQQLYAKIFYEGAEGPRRLSRFFMLMGFATTIAFFGIADDSTAVVIGAMLVAPLMTPLMGTSLAMIMGWPRRATITGLVALAGIALAVGLSILYGWALAQPVSPVLNSQVASRIEPTLIDLMVAIAAGGAGAFAMSRPDVSDSLPGVAVAIALVPPLSVVGLMISQNDWSQALGALLLFATNLVAILLVGAIVFVLSGVVPLFQLSRNAKRIRLSIGMALILAVVVVGVLGVSTSRFQLQAAGTSAVDRAVETWLDGTDLTATSVDVKGDSAVVVVEGPTEPPPVEDLADEVEQEWGQPMDVMVDWIPRTTYEYPAAG